MSNSVKTIRIGKQRKVFGELDIPSEFIDKVMSRAGYGKRHLKGDWVRGLAYKKRFHVSLTSTGIEFHLDRTNDKHKHYVADWESMVALERRRIRTIYRELNPNWTPASNNEKRSKNQVAPNLMELQRKHKTTIYRPTRWEKIKSFLFKST